MSAFRIIRRLRDLIDVDASSPSDGDVLAYDSGSGKWENSAAAGGGSPTTADYLVGTSQAGLSAEIVVGTSPGGELGGTWASPTVDATHSGSSHASVQAAAEATAAAALTAHEADTTNIHGIADTSALLTTTAGDAAYQPKDSDLTAIAGLSPSNDDIVQRKAGSWVNRTIAQLKSDLSLSGTNTGDQTSVTGNAGTATALATARNIDGQSFDGTANITVIAPGTHAATGKTTPVDADELPLVDSAASNVLKKVTWANVKATLKTYFDTLYATVTHTHAASDIASGTIAQARLGTGSGGAGTKVLYDDQTYKTPSSGGSVATDAIFDAKGDLAVGTGADTAAKLTAGANGTVPTYQSGQTTGILPQYPPGYEIGYAQITGNVTISATSEASPTDLGLSLGAITYDGTPILLEFFYPSIEIPTGAIFLLFDGSTMLCRLHDVRPAGSNQIAVAGTSVIRLTPSAGSHTYKIMAIRVGGSNATVDAGAGTGGAGVYAPTSLRATKV